MLLTIHYNSYVFKINSSFCLTIEGYVSAIHCKSLLYMCKICMLYVYIIYYCRLFLEIKQLVKMSGVQRSGQQVNSYQ